MLLLLFIRRCILGDRRYSNPCAPEKRRRICFKETVCYTGLDIHPEVTFRAYRVLPVVQINLVITPLVLSKIYNCYEFSHIVYFQLFVVIMMIKYFVNNFPTDYGGGGRVSLIGKQFGGDEDTKGT